MIFWKDDKGAICCVAHATDDGGFVVMDGAHVIRLTREDCYQLATLLMRHLLDSGEPSAEENKKED